MVGDVAAQSFEALESRLLGAAALTGTETCCGSFVDVCEITYVFLTGGSAGASRAAEDARGDHTEEEFAFEFLIPMLDRLPISLLFFGLHEVHEY